MQTKKLNLPHKEGGGEFTITLGFKRGNIEEKSVTDWDTVTVQRSTLAAEYHRTETRRLCIHGIPMAVPMIGIIEEDG